MANTQPIAEAVIKVKLDPASLDFVRGQLKGLNNAANVSGISGGGSGGSAVSQALATGIGARFGGGSGGGGGGGGGEKERKDSLNRYNNYIKGKGVLAEMEKLTVHHPIRGLSRTDSIEKGIIASNGKNTAKMDIGELNKELAADIQAKSLHNQKELTKEQEKQTKELKKQEGQLRTNLSLAKTHLDTITRTIKYLAAPIAGLGILGFRKYLETLDAGAINLRKAIGGLTYSWNQFLARVGDTINKSYGLQKIIQNISKILDNMDEKKIKMLFDVGIALAFLFVVTKISTAVVTIARMLSTMRTAMSTFSLAGMFNGPAAAGAGAAEGAGAVAGGATTGGILSGIGTALLKFGKIAIEVTAVILILARVMGVEGKSSTEVLINIFKALWEALKWVGDFLLKLTQDIISAFELIGNIFITIGDSINFLANKWNELFAGGPTDSLEKFKAKLSDVWGNWINQVNSTGFGATKKQEEEKKKYVFGGTTTTSTFAGLNKLAQDLADNTMLMAADKMDQAADKMNSAVDKINNQWSDYDPANKPLIFNPSFATF